MQSDAEQEHAARGLSRAATYRRAVGVLLVTLVSYGVLVGTNEGEFWPFSVYPMFSRAGQPWTRALARTAEYGDLNAFENGDGLAWDTLLFEELPGVPLALRDHNMTANDLAGMVAQDDGWDDGRASELQRMLGPAPSDTHAVVIYRASGRLAAHGSVEVRFLPVAVLHGSKVSFNPALGR